MLIKFNTKSNASFRNQILAELPEAGGGLNTGILVAPRKLMHWCGDSRGQAFDLLYPLVCERRGRDCSKEVWRQVNTAYDSTDATRKPTGPSGTHYELGLWRKLGIPEQSLYDLWEASPIKWDDEDRHTEEVIDSLFPHNPWLCCGLSVREFETRRREDWRGLLSQLSLIVPSPAISKTGLTQEGYESEHALTQFPARKYVAVEFDAERDKDVQASILLWLAEQWPLRLVVDSAGKSLHGWFDSDGTDEGNLKSYFNDLVRLGADPRTYTRSQFVRLPDGTRDNSKRQSILYFNAN
jgi:hypothetical protein